MIVARQIADAAVDAMAPGDLAAIVTTGGGVPQNLTADRARLHKTIAGSDWSQTLSQAQMDDPILAQLGMNDPSADGRCLCGLCAMDTITRIANDLRDVPRRKVLLFVGSNLIVQVRTSAMNNGLSCDKLARDSREKLFDALGTSGLTVHSIDPQGLATVGPATRASVPNGIENRDGAALNAQLTGERLDFMQAQGNLDVLPALTGGRTILNNNEPFRLVPGVLQESDAYYLVAFEPIEGSGEVRHDIQVKVARKGVDVHTARYIAAGGCHVRGVRRRRRVLPWIARSRVSLPDASLPLGMSVATFAGADPAPRLRGRHARCVGVRHQFRIELPSKSPYSASDERGRRVGAARQTATVQVPPGGRQRQPATFVELQTYMTLPPGDYELRAAVMNTQTRLASSVFTHVTVPSFDDAASRCRTSSWAPLRMPARFPTARRRSPSSRRRCGCSAGSAPAWAFLRVYRATGADATQPVNLETSVLDSAGTRVSHQSDALRDAAFAGRNADVRLPLPLADLAPGLYALRIDARQGRNDASRTIAFTVVKGQPAVPAIMDETDERPATRQVVTGHATYADFKKVTVTTSEGTK